MRANEEAEMLRAAAWRCTAINSSASSSTTRRTRFLNSGGRPMRVCDMRSGSSLLCNEVNARLSGGVRDAAERSPQCRRLPRMAAERMVFRATGRAPTT